jgi:hypothetical protein
VNVPARQLPNPVWRSLEEFYAEDERRRGSSEVDFGDRWLGSHGAPAWRLSYVEATGEAIFFHPEHGVELVGWALSAGIFARVLKGWVDAHEERRSYFWVRQRIRIDDQTVMGRLVTEQHRAKARGY